jgi:ABC-type sugar transport system substrate-binding protein
VGQNEVVVSLLSADQEFQRLQADDARAAAKASGLEARVLFAENNATLQIQQLYRFIHLPAEERPLAVVVETVAGEGLERVARAAAGAGIGWILVNRRVGYVEALRRDHPGLPIASVSTDQIEVGRIQARQFQALIGSAAVALYVQGPLDTSAAQDRLSGTQQGLAGTGIELKILDGQWTEASGQEAVGRWLRLKSNATVRPALVGCQNDAMAVGACRALASSNERPDLARIPVTGVDGLPDGGRRLVDVRQLAATIVTPSNTGPAIGLLADFLRTHRALPPVLVLQPQSYPPEATLQQRARA